MIHLIHVLDRDNPDAATAAYGVRRPDGTLERREPSQWWVIDADDRILSGPFTNDEDAREAVLWTEGTQGDPSESARAAFGVRRPDDTLERQLDEESHSTPPRVPEWWAIDRNDNVLVGPFTSAEDAEATARWVKAAAPFHVDGGPDAVAAAYGVCRPDETLEHWLPGVEARPRGS